MADAATLADVVRRMRERDGVALTAPERATDYSHREFATSTWKAANLLSHYGVRGDAGARIVVGPKAPGVDAEAGRLGTAADPLFALLGATLLGGPAVLVGDGQIAVLVAPTAWLDRYEAPPSATRVGYGAAPPEPGDVHFEREAWSENPIEPPERVGPADVALRVDVAAYTHADLLAAVDAVTGVGGFDDGSVVGLDATLDDPAVLVAGVLAPLAVGATVALRDREAAHLVDGDGPLEAAAADALDA